MSWRPEGWNNPYRDKNGCWEWQCFERGANAILEALRTSGDCHIGCLSYRWAYDAAEWADNHKGQIVFIPEDKET